MYDVHDLGGTPADEACAQLGQTADFARLNRLEVECYRAAVIARFGPPPEGCALVSRSNHHDFGTYRTLALNVWHFASARDAVAAYVDEACDGLGSWIEAGFTEPVVYDDGNAAPSCRRFEAVVLGAMMTTRPGPTGAFPIPEFAPLHHNLIDAFPEIARSAASLLQGVPA